MWLIDWLHYLTCENAKKCGASWNRFHGGTMPSKSHMINVAYIINFNSRSENQPQPICNDDVELPAQNRGDEQPIVTCDWYWLDSVQRNIQLLWEICTEHPPRKVRDDRIKSLYSNIWSICIVYPIPSSHPIFPTNTNPTQRGPLFFFLVHLSLFTPCRPLGFSLPFLLYVLNWYNQCLIGSFALVDCWRYHNIIPYYTIRTAPFISPLWIWISIPRAETSLDSLSKSKRFYTGCSCQAALPYTASCWFYPFFPTWGVKPTEFIWRVYIGSIPLEEARLHWIKGEWVEVETRWSGLLPLQPSNTHPTDTALNHLRWCAWLSSEVN